jgi:ribonuclease BN (tRNA processing enzyme)
MKIKVLGAHNTESRHTRCASLLVDNTLVLDAGGLTSSLSFRDQIKIKALLLTHGHYDHMRDIPAFAMNLYLRKKSVDLYTHQAAADNLLRYFLDGGIYPEFHKRPENAPTLRMHILKAYEETRILDYTILPAPVLHALPSMGYQIASARGETIFYTGDTGPGLSQVWNRISPQLLFIELTAPNRWEKAARDNGHMTSVLLQQELTNFREIKGYLPRVICIHINPENEKEIRSEISAVADSLGAPIQLAHEGMTVEV